MRYVKSLHNTRYQTLNFYLGISRGCDLEKGGNSVTPLNQQVPGGQVVRGCFLMILRFGCSLTGKLTLWIRPPYPCYQAKAPLSTESEGTHPPSVYLGAGGCHRPNRVLTTIFFSKRREPIKNENATEQHKKLLQHLPASANASTAQKCVHHE